MFQIKACPSVELANIVIMSSTFDLKSWFLSNKKKIFEKPSKNTLVVPRALRRDQLGQSDPVRSFGGLGQGFRFAQSNAFVWRTSTAKAVRSLKKLKSKTMVNDNAFALTAFLKKKENVLFLEHLIRFNRKQPFNGKQSNQ